MKPGRYPFLITGVLIVVVAVVVAALWVIGPPGEQRALRLDERRVADLREIARAADLYRTQHGELPASLDTVREGPPGMIMPTDPVTSQPYEYRALDELSYELCAIFDRESTENGLPDTDVFWSHMKGRQCFRVKSKDVKR